MNYSRRSFLINSGSTLASYLFANSVLGNDNLEKVKLNNQTLEQLSKIESVKEYSLRKKVLENAVYEHSKEIAEDTIESKGSSKYIQEKYGLNNIDNPWCAFFASTMVNNSLSGGSPWGIVKESREIKNWAIRNNAFIDSKEINNSKPGDLIFIRYHNEKRPRQKELDKMNITKEETIGKEEYVYTSHVGIIEYIDNKNIIHTIDGNIRPFGINNVPRGVRRREYSDKLLKEINAYIYGGLDLSKLKE